MDWQDILMIAIAVLLLLVWVPVLFIAVRRALQADEKNRKEQ
jgi:Zn-dependent membrane protease YugP